MFKDVGGGFVSFKLRYTDALIRRRIKTAACAKSGASPHRKRHLDRFSRFCRAHICNKTHADAPRRAGFKGGAGLPPTEGLPPFIFYFSLMIDAYETTT